jgi:hypothetical protein
MLPLVPLLVSSHPALLELLRGVDGLDHQHGRPVADR